MNKVEVLALMESSKTEAEWNANCDKVQAACGGYPDFWYSTIVQSGLANRVATNFGKTADITLEAGTGGGG